MFIYNTTTKVDAAIAPKWLAWMQAEHIPAMLATGCFTTHTLVRLIDVDDSDGPTYAVQYKTPTRAAYDWYITEHENGMQESIYKTWGDRVLSFSTLMEVVQ